MNSIEKVIIGILEQRNNTVLDVCSLPEKCVAQNVKCTS